MKQNGSKEAAEHERSLIPTGIPLPAFQWGRVGDDAGPLSIGARVVRDLGEQGVPGRLAGLARSSDATSGVVPLNLPRGRALVDAHNARLKLYQVTPADIVDLARDVEAAPATQSERDRVTKIIVYARPGQDEAWTTLGFRREAAIRGFHADRDDAVLWSAFLSAERSTDPRHDEHERIVRAALARGARVPVEPKGYRFGCAQARDVAELSSLLKLVFTDYPSSLEVDHLCRLIEASSSFFVTARDEAGALVATMSAEIDKVHGAAEMTDCATRPDHRGRGLMPYLLAVLEREVPRQFAIRDFYTIARADPAAINAVFARQGYEYTGRLVNNCRMPNGWESMNVWCKQAAEDGAVAGSVSRRAEGV